MSSQFSSSLGDKMQTKNLVPVSFKWDRAGIACSIACVLHCTLIPALAFLSPTISSFFGNEWIHLGLLALLIPVAIVAFYRGQKAHSQKLPLLLGGLGMAFLIFAIATESILHIEKLETLLTIIGCIFLILAHFFNIKFFNDMKQTG